jgi:hypothetical protein
VARELVRPKYITSGSKSPWLVWNAAFHSSPSPVFFVKKKDGGLRFIQDYPLPVINDLINRLKGARFFTKLDVRWGFNNVRIRELLFG